MILHRLKFNQCVQESGQCTADFIAKLRRLAEKCDFGQSFDSMLRDRLVCGVRDSALQKRLLAEEDSLTFAAAEKLSPAAESVSRDVGQLTAGRTGTESTPEAVHRAAWQPASRPCPARRAPGSSSRSVGPPRAAAAAVQRRGAGAGRGAAPAGRGQHRDCYRCGGQCTTLATVDSEIIAAITVVS